MNSILKNEVNSNIKDLIRISNNFIYILKYLKGDFKVNPESEYDKDKLNSYLLESEDSLNKLSEICEELSKEEVKYMEHVSEKLSNINWTILYEFNESADLIRKVVGSESTLEEIEETKVKKISNHFISIHKEITNRIDSISLFTKIYKVQNNIVIVGPNGSGKSNFARNLKGLLSNDITIISAQRLLYYKPPTEIHIQHSYSERIREFQEKTKLSKDNDYLSLAFEDFTLLLLALFEEKRNNVYDFYYKKEYHQSKIDRVIEIWQELCPDKTMIQSREYELSIESKGGQKYDFNMLSDGEKAIFYYIGHTLLAKESSYILIDEPENHLHLSGCIKLWDLLEVERNDCKFIYITHNLEFASSRKDKTLIWNETYKPPYDWKFEIIEKDEDLPEKYLIEMLGSRKKIIFCEGNQRNSLDYQIYQSLFPNFHIIPVEGHEQVKNYVRASKKNKFLINCDVKGIIDGDSWNDHAKNKYKKENIHILPFNEIENLICSESVLQAAIDMFEAEDNAFEKFKEHFFKNILKNNDKLSLRYTRNSFNNYVKSNALKNNKSIDGLIAEMEQQFTPEKIKEIYGDRKTYIENLVTDKKFNELMKVNDLKEGLIDIARKYIVSDYENKIKRSIQKGRKKILNAVIHELGEFYTDITSN